MKLRNTLKLVGIALFLGALLLMLYFQNPACDALATVMLISFAVVIAFSGVCFITGEILAKIETLENKVKLLEEELIKLKNRGNDNE